MKFIKLTRYHNDGVIYINIDKIEAIQPTSNFEKGAMSTSLSCIGDVVYEVNESPKEILEKMHHDIDWSP